MSERRDLQELTSLKGIFIWIIVLHNTLSVNTLFEAVRGMTFLRLFGGDFGNCMFFALSGFLMAYGYRGRIVSRSMSFGPFMRRRLQKLYPMYALTNLAALLIAVWTYGISAFQIKKITFTFLLQMGGGLDSGTPYNGPSWFVSALFACYILYFVAVRFSGNKVRYHCFLAICVILGYFLEERNLMIPYCFTNSGIAYQNFFLGCTMAELIPYLKDYRRYLASGGAIVLGLIGVLMWRYGVEVIGGNSVDAFTYGICPLILYLASENGVFSYFLRWKPFVYMGRISLYVFYWHMIVYAVLLNLMPVMTEISYGVFILLLVVICMLAYRFAEGKKKVQISAA